MADRAKCPVCTGRGWVTARSGEPIKCHGCDGEGYVDPEEGVRQNEPVDDPRELQE